MSRRGRLATNREYRAVDDAIPEETKKTLPPEARILVIKLADIGDVLTATPALRAFRQTYPAAVVDLLTTPAAATIVPSELCNTIWVAQRNLATIPAQLPALARLLVGLRRQSYDAVVLLHHLTLSAGVLKYRLLTTITGAAILAGLNNGKGAWLTHSVSDHGFGALHEVVYALAVARRLGATTTDLSLAARYGDRELQEVRALVPPVVNKLRIVIHPGSGGYSLARRWDPEKWATLGDVLAEHYGAQVVLVGTLDDGVDAVVAAMQAPAVNLVGQTTLPQLAALLSQSSLFLGADSGIMHLAAAVGLPTVALFGPSNPEAWGPWTPESPSTVVRLGLGCSPCSYVGHAVGQRDGCWHRSCMVDLGLEQIVAAARALLDQSEAGTRSWH